MIIIFLGFNALLYMALGVWCLLRPVTTAAQVGYTEVSNQGTAEFVAVYGGLEFALGVFFALCAYSPALRNAGILFAALLYLGLVLFRSFSLLLYSSDIGAGWNFYFFEIALLAISLYLAFRSRSELLS